MDINFQKKIDFEDKRTFEERTYFASALEILSSTTLFIQINIIGPKFTLFTKYFY